MGYRTSLDINARCPLYEGVVHTKNGTIAGVQCSYLHSNFGFDASIVVRCKNFSETIDMKELFCDSMYRGCPYYQAWLGFQGAQTTPKKRIK